MGAEGKEADEEWCGGWTRWSARLAGLLALPVLLTGAYSTNYVFLAAHVPHRCLVPECKDAGTWWAADKAPEWAGWALLGGEACSRPKPLGDTCTPAAFDNSSTVQCEQFVYGPGNSIVEEFGLACQEWKRTLVGTVHNVGMLVSLPLLGALSDRCGRRAALVVSAVGAGALGLAKSFAPGYMVYIAVEFAETVLGASVYPAAFVLLIEWLDAAHRIQTSLVLGVPLAMGTASVAALDWAAGGWRTWARLAYPPSFILLLYPWLLPESVRWLVARGRHAEAGAVVRRAAAVAGRAPPADLARQDKEAAGGVGGAGGDESLFHALLHYRALRLRLAVCFVWWFSALFVFYGLAVNAAALAGSPHRNYALLAAAQLPALAANTLLLERLGRRALLAAALLLTAAALVLCALLRARWPWLGTALFLCGQCGATMSLNALYVYTAELFPTGARQRLLAACSAVGRLGSIVAPLTPLLAARVPWAPTAVFGALPLLGAALAPLLPDTLRRPLPRRYADLAAEPPSASDRDHPPCPTLSTIS